MNVEESSILSTFLDFTLFIITLNFIQGEVESLRPKDKKGNLLRRICVLKKDKLLFFSMRLLNMRNTKDWWCKIEKKYEFDYIWLELSGVDVELDDCEMHLVGGFIDIEKEENLKIMLLYCLYGK